MSRWEKPPRTPITSALQKNDVNRAVRIRAAWIDADGSLSDGLARLCLTEVGRSLVPQVRARPLDATLGLREPPSPA
jgi:hypothetical protein